MTSQKKIVLFKPKDWDTWILFVRIKATSLDIWDLINPDLPVKPISREKPIEPIYDADLTTAVFDKNAYETYKTRYQIYEFQLDRYKKQKEAFVAILSYIQETITVQNAVLIQKTEAHPYSILKALKERLAPSDSARSLYLEKRYGKLKKGPGNDNQNIGAWLNEWQQMYIDATIHNLAEISGTRPIRDFLLAIHAKDPAYAAAQLTYQDVQPRTMDQIIENYRQHVRLCAVSAAKKDIDHSAFATNAKPTFKGKDQQGKTKLPTCICGDKMWYADCPYLVANKAPAGWKEDRAIRQKVNKALEDSKIQSRVTKSLENRAKIAQSSFSSINITTSPPANIPITTPKVFTTSFSAHHSAIATTVYSTSVQAAQSSNLRDVLILGSAADMYVCNSSMKHLYKKEREADIYDKIQAGKDGLAIESYGSLPMTFDTPDGPETVTLNNVAYVPQFLTNIAALNKFTANGVHFDSAVPHMHVQNKTMFNLYRIGDHCTFTKPPHQVAAKLPESLRLS